jgi:metalloendopeptidase OMA1, mitochondrial
MQAFRLLLCAFVALLIGCATNPYTNRWQFVMFPKSYENKLGAQAYQQVLQDPKVQLSSDPREVEPAKRVADRIIEAAKQSKYAETAKAFDWEVSVIKDDKTVNAFALPGGKIAVYTGIYPVARNEAGLAAVMGHEVVHALARHGAERMSQGLATQVLLTGASVAMQTQGTPAAGAIMQALGLGAQVGVLLPFSRAHESEADHVGIILSAMAGYDPREAVALWQRMEQKAGSGQPPEFVSTHPSHETRIKQLQEWMPEALQHYEQSKKVDPAPMLPNAGP